MSQTEKAEFCLDQVTSWANTMDHEELVHYFIDHLMKLGRFLTSNEFYTIIITSTNRGNIMNIYQQKGFNTRKEYLSGLAEDFGIDESIVFGIASMLGSNEDFDGLINALEDFNMENEF